MRKCYAVSRTSILFQTISLLAALYLFSLFLFREERAALLREVTKTTSTPTTASAREVKQQKEALDPVQVFEEWKRYHSVEALRQSNLTEREFIVAAFNCPYQVGVRASDLLNALLLAVATNRTFLYHYHTNVRYKNAGENLEEECNQVLQKHDWVPRFEDFSRALPPKQPFFDRQVHAPEHSYASSESVARFKKVHDKADHDDDAALFPPLAVNHTHSPVVEVHRYWSVEWGVHMKILDIRQPYTSIYFSHAFGKSPALHQQERIQRLYKEGPVFLHGMLFRQLFDFAPDLVESVAADRFDADRNHAFSIGMHSRHTEDRDEGDNIEDEVACLDALLEQPEAQGKPCVLYLMADRPKTLALVGQAGRERNCTIVVTSQPILRNSTRARLEHGVFAGVGYFMDLLVTSQARSAFMSGFRSSSLIPYELMEYNRRMEAWEQEGGIRELDAPLECKFQRGLVERPSKVSTTG